MEHKGRPKTITYMSVAGEWERKLHPDWPEWMFKIPDEIPYGTIYYVRKGTDAGFGLTAYIEKSPEGYAIKTPKNNPYSREEEVEHIQSMRVEAEVYRRIGPDCPYIPKLIEWDPETCCLTLEFLDNDQLGLFIKGRKPPDYEEDKENPPYIEPAIRRRWALQVTRGLIAVHAVGVIHGDLTPRNLLLDADLNVRIADFAGSCLDGAGYEVCAGERYIAPDWSFKKKPEITDDLFVLGGILYFIMTSREPHYEVESEFDVGKLYRAGTFPDTASIECGAVIRGCWDRTLRSADEVLEQLLLAFGKDEDPFSGKTT